MKHCEFCPSDNKVLAFPLGGIRKSLHSWHRNIYVYLCLECRLSLLGLIDTDRVRHRSGPKDTTNSRFAIAKAAVKRDRFGNANMPIKEIREKFYGKEA